MKQILYIGNHLSRGGAYPSVAEGIAPLLLPEVRLRLVSRRKNQVLRMLDMLLAIILYGRREAPVVIDVYSTLNFYYALACGLLCQLLSVPYHCVLHGGNLPERLDRWPRASRYLFGRADRLIAPSRYLQDAFAKRGYEAVVVPNFLPIENYGFRLRRQLQPRLLWVRAFDAIYNPALAIRILKGLQERYPGASLCMVGPDKDGSQATCRELAKSLGVAERVRFTGRLPKAEWIALSRDYDIFINTTNFDNTPVSVMEAMALGLPVVSTNAGGLPFLITHDTDGLLVPVGDEEAFLLAISRLLDDAATAEKLSRNGRKKVERFAWEQVKPLWCKLLLEQ